MFNLRWPGQYYDKESGLFYNYFRSYSAGLGRYTQGDPLGLYDDESGVLKRMDPPGAPVPKRFGGLFISPGIKRDARICLRWGVFVSPPIPVPVPSLDMGPMP